MRRLGSLVAVAAMVLIGVPAAAAATPPLTSTAATGPTCHGKRATIIGRPGYHVAQGTPGNDVIVSNGSSKVDAGDGDDVVCVTGHQAITTVSAGSGNDTVDASRAHGEVDADLGSGSDHYTGSRFVDDVSTGHNPDNVRMATSYDVVHTGPGADEVFVDSTGGNLASHSEVRLGRDGGTLWDGGQRVSVDAGSSGESGLITVRTRPGPLRIDDRVDKVWTTARAAADSLLVSYTGTFRSFLVANVTDLRFHGTDRPETVYFPEADVNSDPPFTVHGYVSMGGGNDSFIEPGEEAGEFRGTLLGGAGHDLLEFGSYAKHSLDVRLSGSGMDADDTLSTRLSGFEDLTLHVRFDIPVSVTGNAAANRIDVQGVSSNLTIRGKQGNDHLQEGSAPNAQHAHASLYGGRGNDWMRGWGGDDYLNGGPGRDRLFGSTHMDTLIGGSGDDLANGGPGYDRCQAERRHGCEVRLR